MGAGGARPGVKAQAQILVRLPPEPVFAFVALDFVRSYPRCSPEVRRLELLTPGPLRLGSRAHQVRVDQGRRTDTTFRVVALDPPSRVGFAEVSGQFEIGYRMDPLSDPRASDPTGRDPEAERTRLTFSFELRRLDLYMRPFEKLIRAAVRDGAEQVVRNIKGLLEGEVAPTLADAP